MNIEDIKIEDTFWTPYQKLINDVVIPYQYQILEDKVEGVEKSHAIENFRIAAGDVDSEFYGMVFQDSDVAKWIEAAAYSLESFKNQELEDTVDNVIDIISRAAQEDGYLNTYFTVKEPEHRWQNLHECHELYCAGHMIEAAVAYYEATGKDKLLNIMIRMSDNMYDQFIVNKRAGYPGHPEVELALMKLYHLTNNNNYMELAKAFVDRRGQEPNFFKEETDNRGWEHFHMNPDDRKYSQNHLPVREQKEAVGHAVRAVYLYTGMADVGMSTGDETLIEACRTLFDNILNKQMYITGGIGASRFGEAFTVDYDIPNDTIYAETCAAIGLIFFANKMLEIEADSKYTNVMERALYNNVLAGMQLDGKRFFYVNPLEVNPRLSGEQEEYRHVLPQRPGWFGCACCPPNVARLLSSLGKYVWGIKDRTVYSHLYISGKTEFKDMNGLQISVEGNYPYSGDVKYTFANVPEEEWTLAIRIPEYDENPRIMINGKAITPCIKKGYAYITRKFADNDVIMLSLDMSPQKIFCNSLVRYNTGNVAIARGPVVYCIEGIDNDGENVTLQELRIRRESKITELEPIIIDDKSIIPLQIEGLKANRTKELYSNKRLEFDEFLIKAIPYFAWGNRGLNQMRVWMEEL